MTNSYLKWPNIHKFLDTDFKTAIEKVTKALKTEGFGNLTTIDIREKIKEKLTVDFWNYQIF